MRVNYLVMSKDKADCRRSVINILNQAYPNVMKSIYILYQEPFPEHFTFYGNVDIIQINVEGITGVDWWMRKVLAYCNAVVGDEVASVTIFFDEDDIYEPLYTGAALDKMKSGSGMVYNDLMLFVEGDKICRRVWKNAISTICVDTKKMVDFTFRFVEKYPEMTDFSGTYPIDSKYFRTIKREMKGEKHIGEKAYFFNLENWQDE